MPQFISTERRSLNVQHIKSYVQLRDGTYTIEMVDGSEVLTSDVDEFGFGDVIPNTTSTVFVRFLTDEHRIADGEIQRLTVLGWLVSGEYAKPIICESIGSEQWCLEEQEAGIPKRWIFPEDAVFASLKAAVDYATETSIEKAKARAARREKLKQAGQSGNNGNGVDKQ